MKKKRAATAAPPVPTIEPTPPPPPAPPAPPPRVLLAPEPPAHIRRDLHGRIVEYDRAPLGLVHRAGDQHAAAAAAAFAPPKTMIELAELRRVRLAEIAAAAEAKRQQIRIESSRAAGPIIAERDKIVQAARHLFDDQRSKLRKEEEETVARIVREARAKFKQLGDDIQAAYDNGKRDAHAHARLALEARAEAPMKAALATVEAETEAARVEVIAWCTEQEGAIREAEKAAAAAAGATLGALAPAPAASASASP